ncbi:unnamed protein product [Ilex paraguariensis]|uniref:RING-type E3 ubiquitin transferase n=1 Tax=Ilex paraguariensis TaxID=185542 RepID=A0ABC8TMK5_9AQUA
MESQTEKVYVAIGTDLQDGFGTLQWVLRKWSSHSISIVILHATNNTSREYVNTPFGKLPATSVNDVQLEDLRKSEQGKIDKILSKYIAFCGKVKVEILKIDRNDEAIHKNIVELISELRITKLVLGFTIMKASSWKSRGAISGSFYVHQNKPNFCELYIIIGGKLVSLREENNEWLIEDDQGFVVAKVREKNGFKGWLGKMFPESAANKKNPYGSPSSSTRNDSPDRWEKCVEEIENYFNHLQSSNSEEDDAVVVSDILQSSSTDSDLPENMSVAEKIEVLKIKIGKAQERIQLKRSEAKSNMERHSKAQWAISISTHRAEELEGRINEEIARRVDLNKEIDSTKEELHEVQSEVEEKKSKFNSIVQLQHELSNKLQLSSLAKSRAETQLEKAVRTRAEMVPEIEKLRKQRDVLQRRIEFCREKDAIGMATRLSDLGFSYKEFTAAEIRVATNNFSDGLRLESAGNWTNVYRARIKNVAVAIKLYDSVNELSQEAFQAKVKLLSHIRHPNIVAMIGFCSELKCIVYEYMNHGCLRDTLFSSSRSSKRRSQGLHWHARIRIAAEVSSGLGFLHQAQPRPIVHGSLNPSKILLDRHNVGKINGFSLGWCHGEVDVWSDIRALGNVILQLLTGRNWAGLVEEIILMMDHSTLIGVLDPMAGEWPLDLTVELAGIAVKCLSIEQAIDKESTMKTVMREIKMAKKKADNLVASRECPVEIEGGAGMEDSSNVPSVFICPIFQKTKEEVKEEDLLVSLAKEDDQDGKEDR